MRILIAGATGAIGSRLVPALFAAGHEVTGTSRSPERAAKLEPLGAIPAVCDALDRDAMVAVAKEARPEVVVHQLTALPKVPDLRKDDIYQATDRLRREGTANLIAAALEVGARRVVAQSIAFIYAPEGGPVKSEDAPVATGAPPPFGRTVAAVRNLETQVTETPGIGGVVLRYGWLYGPGTYFAPDGFIAGEVRRRRYPLIGSAAGISSFIHVDDAASMTVAAVDGGAPGIYNAVDDEPIALRDWLPIYATALGAKKPFRVPRFVARLAAGPVVAGMATTLRGASNARGKEELGWTLRYPSVREGFAAP